MKTTSLSQIKKSDLLTGFYASSRTYSYAYRHAVSGEALFWSWFWQLTSTRAAAAATEAATAIKA